MSDVITTAEASKLTGYSQSTIRQLCASGKIDATKVGRDWLVDRISLLEYHHEMESLGRQKHNPHKDK